MMSEPAVDQANEPTHENVPETVPSDHDALIAPLVQTKHVMLDDDEEESEDPESFSVSLGLPYADHNYDAVDPSKRVKEERSAFPVLVGLSNMPGYVDEQVDVVDTSRTPSQDRYSFDHQAQSVFRNSREGQSFYRNEGGQTRPDLLIGGKNYKAPSATSVSSTIPAGFKTASSVQRDYQNLAQSQPYYAADSRRLGGSPQMYSQPVGGKAAVTLPKKPGRPRSAATVGVVRPVGVPLVAQMEPPHRAMQKGQVTAAVPSQHVPQTQPPFSPNDPMRAANEHAPAPFIVPARGARPTMRGRGGSQSSARVKGKEMEDMPVDDEGYQRTIYRSTSSSPRKQVNFSDGVMPGRVQLISQPLVRSQAPQLTVAESMLPQSQGVDAFRDGIPAATTDHSQIQARMAEISRQVEMEQAEDAAASAATATSARELSPAKRRTVSESGSLGGMFSDPPDVAAPRGRGRPKGSTGSATSDRLVARSRNSLSSSSSVGGISVGSPQRPRAPVSPSKLVYVTGSPTRTPQGMCVATNGSPARQSMLSVTNDVAPTGIAMPSLLPSGGQFEHLQPGAAQTSFTQRPVYNIPVTSPQLASAGRPRKRKTSPRGSGNYDDDDAVPSMLTENAAPIRLHDLDERRPLQPVAPQHPILVHPITSTPLSNNKTSQAPMSFHDMSEPSSQTEESDSSSSDEEDKKLEEDWGDYVTRCLCTMQHDDDNMIECDACQVWQHMVCMGVNPKDPPKMYQCELCKPRVLKLTQAQAQEGQLKILKQIQRATEKRRAEQERRKQKRREEKRAAKTKKRAEEAVARAATAAALAKQKFVPSDKSQFTRRARELIKLHEPTPNCATMLSEIRETVRAKSMKVESGVTGLVATDVIEGDSVIMEYVSQVCLPDEVEGGRERVGQIQPFTVLYAGLGNDDHLVLDSRKVGTDSRFVRRSCRPNASLKHVLHQQTLYVVMVARERINKHTEVTIPFDIDFRNHTVALTCACNEASCSMKEWIRTPRSLPGIKNQNGTPRSGRAEKTPQTQSARKDGRGRPRLSSSASDKKVASPVATPMFVLSEKQPKSVRKSSSRRQQADEIKSETDSAGEDIVAKKESTYATGVDEEMKEEPASSPRRTRSSTMSSTTSESARVSARLAKTARKEEKTEVKEEESPRSRSPRKDTRAPMDYTLPTDRNKKLSREERKLQADMERFEKLEKKQQKDTPKENKRSHKRGSTSGTSTSSTKEERGRRSSYSERTDMNERTSSTRPTSARRTPKKEPKEEHIEPARTPASAPPRKRWAQQQQLSVDTAEQPTSPVREPAATPVVGGKKSWLLRRAQEDANEAASTADKPKASTSTKVPPLSPPLKKRRHMLEAGASSSPAYLEKQLSSQEAAALLTQMSGQSMASPIDTRQVLHQLALCVDTTKTVDFTLSPLISPAGPSEQGPSTAGAKEEDVKAEEMPAPRKQKRLSMEEYKRRKESAEQARLAGEGIIMPPPPQPSLKSNFIPQLNDVNILESGRPLLLAPVPDPKNLVAASTSTSIEDLKKSIYGEMAAKPVAGMSSPPPGMAGLGSPTGGGSSADEDTPRQSLDERLASVFGVPPPPPR